jgi:hypothetical protein
MRGGFLELREQYLCLVTIDANWRPLEKIARGVMEAGEIGVARRSGSVMLAPS